MKQLSTLVLFFFITLHSITGQQLDLENWKNLNFRNIGPAGMSGRITAIDVDLSNPDRIYVGSASGGVWLSENGGVTWDPIFDDQPVLSIGSLKINQKNPDEIWVGTGEGNPRNSLNTGKGIYKSIDGGKTWKFMGLEKTKTIHRIIIDSENPNTVYAGAMGAPWGPNKERGVFKTTDGGKTWKKILYVNDTTGVGDMVADPTNPNKIIVGMYQHSRQPWFFTSGGEGSGLYITYDGGDNWKKLTHKEGIPKGDLGRMGIAMAPSNPDIIYALIEAKENGLYKSEDGGEKWSLVSKKDIGNRPFYYAEIYVDPQNENRIYNLWSYVSKSEDGGKTFKTIMDYGNNVHPDHHAFWIHPDDPSYLINGNDGGLNISRDRGENWRFVQNLPVGQFYHVNIDNDWPYNVYGGMQDNGSWIGPSMVLKSGGIRNYDFQELYFGDGFDVVPYPGDSRYGWAMSQGGNVGFYDRETGETKNAKPAGDKDHKLRYNWNAAIAQDPKNPCGAYFGSQFLHYTDDCGDSWVIKSPDLTTNDTSRQHANISGGLTMDATQAENFTTILSIAPSAVDANVIWVGTDDGNLQLTTDGGDNWSNIASRLRGVPAGAWIPQIVVSEKNAGEAFVIVNDYRRNNYSAYAYHTTDYGKSFTRIADDNQIGSFVLSIVQDPVEPNLLFLGSDAGLYMSLNKGKSWTHMNEGFPSVQVSDLKIHPREHDLVIGTFGRAFWILDDIRPLRKLASNGLKALDSEFMLFDSPKAYHTNNRSYDGIRFIAQGEFVGDNKSVGYGKINTWIKPVKEGKKKDKEVELKVYVKNSEGDTIRTIKRKVNRGYDSFGWFLDEDGVRYPSKRKVKKDDDAPGGLDVMPGKYTVIVVNGDHTDSTMVEVDLDPRSELGVLDFEAKLNAQKDFMSTVTMATDAFDRIQKMKNSTSKVKDMMANQPDSIKTEVDSLSKIINMELDSLEGVYMMKSGLKGIQRNPDLLNGNLRSASSYLRSSWGKPGGNTDTAIEYARQKTVSVANHVNTFMDEKWKPYEARIKAIQLKIFEDLEPVSIE